MSAADKLHDIYLSLSSQSRRLVMNSLVHINDCYETIPDPGSRAYFAASLEQAQEFMTEAHEYERQTEVTVG